MRVYLKDLWFSEIKDYVPVTNIGLFAKDYIERK